MLTYAHRSPTLVIKKTFDFGFRDVEEKFEALRLGEPLLQ
jgi:hypothetical protein